MSKNKYQGFYNPINPEKYMGNPKDIVYRSGWERKLMVECDTNPNILKWGSEVVVVPYYSQIDKKVHRYFVDFIVTYKTKSGEIKTDLIEVKPYSQTIEPKQTRGKSKKSLIYEAMQYQKNQDKWAAAKKYAEKQGWNFRIMTEYELGIKKRK